MIRQIGYNFIKNFVAHQKLSKVREDGEFLIVSTPSLELLFLNAVAKDFYEKVNGNNSIEKIVELLLEEYEIDRETLINDITKLVRDFQWKGILELKNVS